MTPAPEPGRLGTALRPEPASRAPCARLGREITPAGLLRERPQIRAVGPGLAFLDHDESRIDAVRGHGAHPSAVSVGRNAPHLHDSSLQHGAKPPLRLAAARLRRLGRVHARNPELHTADAAADDDRVPVADVFDLRLSQIMTNFLNNATKFTKSGYIKLGYEIDFSTYEVSIYVEDTGKGIPKEEQRMIFERFYKQDEFVQGTGLGLSISMVIAEKLGGKISVASEIGKGSRFTFLLPYHNESEEFFSAG